MVVYGGGQCVSVWFFAVACVKTFEIQHCDSSGEHNVIYYMYDNCRGKGTGMVGVQTVVYLRCAANQRNVVRQSNYALKAINGAGNDLIVLENKRKTGNADLTRLEKSDLSRDFFPAWIS